MPHENNAETAIEKKDLFDIISSYNPYSISLHHANYILPYAYNSTISSMLMHDASDKLIKKKEVKFQLSFKIPLIREFLIKNTRLYAAYTQLSFWQVYTDKPYFRESNYEPEIFVTHLFNENIGGSVSINHQSNGLAGESARSWNRVLFDGRYATKHYWISLQPWILIFKKGSSDAHNPDITHYLGHEQLMVGSEINRFSLNVRVNNLESGLKRGGKEFNVAYKIKDHLHIYTQFFTGYGQSLIQYNRRATGFGIGFAINGES